MGVRIKLNYRITINLLKFLKIINIIKKRLKIIKDIFTVLNVRFI